MKIAVRVHSRSGNTKKIADAIGKAVHAPVQGMQEPWTGPVDVLFVGGAIYAGRIDAPLKAFLNELTATQVKCVAVFSTAFGKISALAQVRSILEPKGIRMHAQAFHCAGKFLFLNKGRPSDADFAQAAAFAKSVVQAL